jgi:hypothetical protein
MTTTTDTVITSLQSLRIAAETPPAFRATAYQVILERLDKTELVAVTMVLCEGNRHGPDAARDLAWRL